MKNNVEEKLETPNVVLYAVLRLETRHHRRRGIGLLCCKVLNAFFYFFLLAGFVFVPVMRAQTAEQHVPNRILLICDTSSAMKKRLPAEEKTIKKLFEITLNGQLQPGDSIGVWTFSRDLRTGAFPLEQWEPEDVMTTPLDIIEFLRKQHYGKSTRFDHLMPLLDRVVRFSPRLTVFIFCDGESQFAGTPADAAINAIFLKSKSTMEKAREPFVIVLRSQFGRYTGYTINAGESINIPQFPPLLRSAAPPAPPPEQPTPPSPAPAPLIIIGTHVGTNLPAPPLPAPVPSPPATAPASSNATPPMSSIASPNSSLAASQPRNSTPETNHVPAAAIAEIPTNTVAPRVTGGVSVPLSGIAVRTSVVTSAVAPQSDTKDRLFVIGAGLLMVAGIGAFSIVRFSRHRESTSLITESLKKR